MDWSHGAFDGSPNCFLSAVSEQSRSRIAQAGKIVTVEANSYLSQEGSEGGFVLLPLQGQLRISKTTERGRHQVMCQVDPNACGGICVLGLSDPAVGDIMALTDTRLVVIAKKEFQCLVRVDPDLCERSWSAATECLSHFSTLVESLSFHKVSERVARTLLDSTSETGELLRLTQAEMAAIVGSTREVVARCLAGMQNDGVIRLGRGRITVLDRGKLAARL